MPDAPLRPTPPFWMTRDRVHGALSDYVDLWSSEPPKPERFEDGDVIFARDVDTRHIGSWPIALAKHYYAGAPDSPSEIVKVGQ